MRRLSTLLIAIVLVAVGCTGTDDDTTTADDTTAADLDDLARPADDESTDDGIGDAGDERAGDGGPTATIPDQDALEPNAVVERVVDGDTIVVEIAGNRERVRLLGIDTPESVAENRPDQCYGAESADYLASVLPEGAEVTLIRDVEARDQFDRLLAYVVRSSDQLFVNLDLLERGYAGVLIYEPNSFYRDLFEDAEDAAFRGDVGLWGVCGGPDVPLN